MIFFFFFHFCSKKALHFYEFVYLRGFEKRERKLVFIGHRFTDLSAKLKLNQRDSRFTVWDLFDVFKVALVSKSPAIVLFAV
jgi:hypothetical protein